VIGGLLLAVLICVLMACWWGAADGLLIRADSCSKEGADAVLTNVLLKALTRFADQHAGAPKTTHSTTAEEAIPQ
jgi:hypothetical protein